MSHGSGPAACAAVLRPSIVPRTSSVVVRTARGLRPRGTGTSLSNRRSATCVDFYNVVFPGERRSAEDEWGWGEGRAGFSIVSTVHGGWMVQSTAIPGGCTRTAYRRGSVSWQGIARVAHSGLQPDINSSNRSGTDLPGNSGGRDDS